jgi:ubiquinone/menaquinone biosynthesis C-methylase UbiE
LDSIERVLGGMDGGRVLDVATQKGRFAQFLADNLKSYSVIVGVDVSEEAIEAAREATDTEGISFSVMDAEVLEFEDEYFDTVAISASMHHMTDVGKVLREMKRVLRPGGRFVVLEMHSDAGTEPELTSVRLHHWAGEIDTAVGTVHNRTFSRDEIVSEVAELGLSNMEEREYLDRESDPMDPERSQKLEEVIGMMSERAAGAADSEGLQEGGRKLISRLREVGFQGEPVLLLIGEKPA